MTMPDTSHLQLPIEEVVPGSPEDPFTAKNQGVSPDQVEASPAKPVIGGTVQAQAVDGPKSPSEPNGTTTPPAPAPATGALPTPEAPARTLAQMLEEDSDAKELIAGLIKEKTGEALRSQQSSYDKKINSLQEDLKAAREAAIKAERESKLSAEDLTDEEKDTLRRKYELDDRETALKEYDNELEGMYKSLTVAKLVESHGQFGVTEEILGTMDDPDAMEVFAKDKELEAYRSGTLPGGTKAVPDRSVTASAASQENQAPVPAGASAPSDTGGGAPASPPIQLSQDAGVDALASNLNKIPWETVRVN